MGKQRNRLRCALFDLTILLVLGGMIPLICQAQIAAGIPDVLAQPAPAAGAAANGRPSFLHNLTVTGFLSSTFGTFIVRGN
jgi:hypothetical protein